jgi:hypothetical protein
MPCFFFQLIANLEVVNKLFALLNISADESQNKLKILFFQ